MEEPIKDSVKQPYEPPRLEMREELVLVTEGAAVTVGAGGTQPMW